QRERWHAAAYKKSEAVSADLGNHWAFSNAALARATVTIAFKAHQRDERRTCSGTGGYMGDLRTGCRGRFAPVGLWGGRFRGLDRPSHAVVRGMVRGSTSRCETP